MKKNTIKKNLLLLLILSLGGSMLLAGFSLSLFIKSNYEETTRDSFLDYHERAKSTFKQMHVDTQHFSEELTKRNEIKNPLNLISEYSDINNYEADIYDDEKKSISHILFNYAKSTQLYEIKIYDKKGWLVSFSRPGLIDKGIVSFNNGRAIVLVSNDDNSWEVQKDLKQIPVLNMKMDIKATESFYIKKENVVAVDSVSSISRLFVDGTEKNIGHIHVTNEIGESVLNTLSKGSHAKHSILLPNNKSIGDGISAVTKEMLIDAPLLFGDKSNSDHKWLDDHDYYIDGYSIPLSNGEKFYLVSSLSKSIVSSQLSETISVMFVVFFVSALLLLPAGLFFSKYSITDPIDKLVKTAKSIESGNYDFVADKNSVNYEIDVLTEALNSAANTVRARETELRNNKDLLEVRVEERTQDLSAANNKLQEENSERLFAELKLAESKKMLQLVIDNIPQLIFWKDTDSEYLGCNKVFASLAGLKNPEEIIGKVDYDLPWKKEESDSYRKKDREVMDFDQAEYNIQETLKTAAGKETDVETNKVPLHDTHGQVIGILGTAHDITEQKIFEREILDAKDIAEKANLAKSEFLSRMSHELRTPLNAILGFAQLLDLDLTGNTDTKTTSNINEIIDAGNHLLELINEVLDLARIESGGMILNIENINIFDVLAESIKITQLFADSKNIVLENLTGSCKQQFAYADEMRLKQIFINFISNAIKYNKDGGKVSLSCTHEDDNTVRFNVSDTGIGISKSNIDKLFIPFERLGIESEGIDGAGIGLVICKELIEHMDGTIGVESQAGKGSTFWFTLPCV